MQIYVISSYIYFPWMRTLSIRTLSLLLFPLHLTRTRRLLVLALKVDCTSYHFLLLYVWLLNVKHFDSFQPLLFVAYSTQNSSFSPIPIPINATVTRKLFMPLELIFFERRDEDCPWPF